MNPRKDIEALVQSATASAGVLRAMAPQFFRCPRGHDLPHRKPWGRCTPAECSDTAEIVASASRYKTKSDGTLSSYTKELAVGQREMDILPLGLERLAFQLNQPQSALEAAADQDRADEAQILARAIARRAARDVLAPPPETPAPPTMEQGAQGYVRQRLQDLAPAALHELEFRLKFGGLQMRKDAAVEILDRAGHNKNPVGSMDFRGPVLIVNNLNVAPWDQQRSLEQKAKTIDVTPERGK